MKLNTYYIYILMNTRNTVLYVGVTNDLLRRVHEHKQGEVAGFTKQYGVSKLVYYEEFATAEDAIAREKQLKRWHREWKLNLAKETNPDFEDLYDQLLG